MVLFAAAAVLDAAPSWEDTTARIHTWSIPQLGTTASLLAGLATALGAAVSAYPAYVTWVRREEFFLIEATILLWPVFRSLAQGFHC